jgi:hypothetical protein
LDGNTLHVASPFAPRSHACSHAYSLSISPQPQRISDRIKTHLQGKSHATSLPPIIRVRASAAYGIGLPKTCYWGLLYTLFWPIREIVGCFLLAGNMQFSGTLHGTRVMCCQSLGHCFRKCGKSNSSWSSQIWYSRSGRVLRWRVGSWQRLANMCRSSSLTALFYLFKNWWVGASLVGFRMSRQ